jgi:hypothetical protein
MGTTVVIADDASDSALVAHPGALMATPEVMKQVQPENVVGSGWTWNPERAPQGPLSIVVSGADRQAWVFRNGEPLGRAAINIDAPGYEVPRAVFSYVGMQGGERRWVAAGVDAAAANRMLDGIRDHVGVAPEFLAAVQDVMRPGDTMVVTPYSIVPPSVAPAPIE